MSVGHLITKGKLCIVLNNELSFIDAYRMIKQNFTYIKFIRIKQNSFDLPRIGMVSNNQYEIEKETKLRQFYRHSLLQPTEEWYIKQYILHLYQQHKRLIKQFDCRINFFQAVGHCGNGNNNSILFAQPNFYCQTVHRICYPTGNSISCIVSCI